MGLCIGLSGGIASGKSTVSKLFQELGIDIIDTDEIARELVNTPNITQEIINNFGDAVITANNLDRTKLRNIIFSNPTAKSWLEDLLHPQIRKIASAHREQSQSPYCIVVIPLLYTRTQYNLDRICMIMCDTEVQVARACNRDNISAAEAEKIINQQPSIEEKLTIADDIIDTNLDMENVAQQVQTLHNSYLSTHLDNI